MIDKAIEMKVDCVKFQMRNLEHVYRSKSIDKTGDDLGTEYIIDLLEDFELVLKNTENFLIIVKKGNSIFIHHGI